MQERLLVPLDGSKDAEIVLPYVVEIASKLGAEITLTRISESRGADAANIYRLYLDSVKSRIQNQVKSYRTKKEVKVFSKVILGNPANELLRYSNEINASLIVMASRGSSGKGPWLLGNIAAKVLRATSKPVLLIRASASSKAIRQKSLLKRILMPLDGSKLGEAAIPYTAVLAQALDAELVLFQAGEIITVSGGFDDGGFYAKPTPQDLDRRKAFGLAYLDGLGKPLIERGLNTSSVLVMGSAADQIMNYSEENDIDLIAMSTHGRSGIGRWVFGSVTDKVLHAGDIPVLVVRPSKK